MILMGSLFAACEEDLKPYAEDTCWVYFDLIGSADTLQSRTFVYAGGDAETDTVWIPLKTIGMVTDFDRPVTLTQVQGEGQNAMAGTHFVSFNDQSLSTEYVIPAGKSTVELPIVLKRDASLKAEKVLVEFTLAANNYFTPGFIGPQTVQIWVTDQMDRPSFWPTASDATLNKKIAPYDPVLHQFLIDATGNKWDDEYIGTLGLNEGFLNTSYGEAYAWWDDQTDDYEAAYMNWLVSKLQEALADENAARAERGEGPLMRSDGTELKIGK
jgi:hypothetical protein